MKTLVECSCGNKEKAEFFKVQHLVFATCSKCGKEINLKKEQK